jgi:hypothetical protein
MLIECELQEKNMELSVYPESFLLAVSDSLTVAELGPRLKQGESQPVARG